MADPNIVMDNADSIRSTGLFSESEIQAAQRGDGFVGERNVDGVGLVKYYITKRGTVEMPEQMGSGRVGGSY